MPSLRWGGVRVGTGRRNKSSETLRTACLVGPLHTERMSDWLCRQTGEQGLTMCMKSLTNETNCPGSCIRIQLNPWDLFSQLFKMEHLGIPRRAHSLLVIWLRAPKATWSCPDPLCFRVGCFYLCNSKGARKILYLFLSPFPGK